MDKNQVANKLWEDVNSIIEASFYNAELSYVKQHKIWEIRALFTLKKTLSSNQIKSLFANSDIIVQVRPQAKRISVKKVYKDPNPS